MLHLGVLIHTASSSLPSSTLSGTQHSSLSLSAYRLLLPLGCWSLPTGTKTPKVTLFPSLSPLPVWHPFACPPSSWFSRQGVHSLPCMEARKQSQQGTAGLSFLPTSLSLERREQKTKFAYLNFGFSQKSVFSEEPQLQIDTAKVKGTSLSQGYGFESSDEKPHEEKWD